jgi:hydroxylamine reductase
MFCYQCQEAAKGSGCDVRGVCGKTEETANSQDLLIYVVKGISDIVTKGNINVSEITEVNHEMLTSLFMTITNANFDEKAIKAQTQKLLLLRNDLKAKINVLNLHDAATFEVNSDAALEAKADAVGILATENEDVRSLRELITYGVKGMAAYAEHALNLGKENEAIYAFIYKAMAATLNDSLSVDALVALTLETGEYGVTTMALLDEANTEKYGNPEITEVNIGVRNNPAILISGHDLADLEQLLAQTEGSGVDVYTHSEMLPAHYYPAFKKYENFVGNYGNAWWKQIEEFNTFNVLFFSRQTALYHLKVMK